MFSKAEISCRESLQQGYQSINSVLLIAISADQGVATLGEKVGKASETRVITVDLCTLQSTWLIPVSGNDIIASYVHEKVQLCRIRTPKPYITHFIICPTMSWVKIGKRMKYDDDVSTHFLKSYYINLNPLGPRLKIRDLNTSTKC